MRQRASSPRCSSVVAAAAALLLAGCALRSRPFDLAYPPEREDASAPQGLRLLPKSPEQEWHRAQRFPSREACRRARNERFVAAVVRARAMGGDAAAAVDLDVRRAVQSRCLAAEP